MTYLHKIQSAFSLIFFVVTYLPNKIWSLLSVSLATASMPNHSPKTGLFPHSPYTLFSGDLNSSKTTFMKCHSQIFLWPSPYSKTPDTPPLYAPLASQIQHLPDIIPISVKSSLSSYLSLGDENKITFLRYSTHCRNLVVKQLSYFLFFAPHSKTAFKFWGILPLHGSPFHHYHHPLWVPIIIVPIQVASTAYLGRRQNSNWSHLPSILLAAAKFSIPMSGLQPILPLLKGLQKVLNAKIRSRLLSLTMRVL